MGHAKQPDTAHHAFMADLHGLLGRYDAIPPLERVAVMSQCIGQLLVQVDPKYSSGQIMESVVINITLGNQQAGKQIQGALDHG